MASFFTRTKSAQDARISLELDDTVIFLHPNAVNTTLDHASMRGSLMLHLSKPRTFQSVTLTMTCWYAAQAPGSALHCAYILCEEADCLDRETGDEDVYAGIDLPNTKRSVLSPTIR